jgi:hypothetical protein
MHFEITEAAYTSKYRISLRFEDGSSGEVDFEKFMEQGTILEKLKDLALFRRFAIEYGTVVWKDEDLDIAPETLYREATGRNVAFQDKSKAVS